MNLKKIILLSCAVPCVFAASTATAQMMAHHTSFARGGMIPHGANRNSGSGFHHFNDRDFDRHHHFHHHRTFVFIDAFGFPFFSPFLYDGYYPYGYYPYGYYPDGDGYGGSSSDYGYDDRSQIAAAQRRLARAGYYHGAIDGILGPQTRRAIRAYEHDHNMTRYGAINRSSRRETNFAESAET